MELGGDFNLETLSKGPEAISAPDPMSGDNRPVPWIFWVGAAMNRSHDPPKM